MSTITGHQALCCLMSSIQESAVGDDPDNPVAEAFDHVYPSSALTWPYCQHHAIVGRALPPSTEPPALSPVTDVPREDAKTTGVIRFHRFEVDVIRCGPPSPDLENPQCLGDLYGDCASPANHETLAGHHLAVDQELDRLVDELLGRWCDCLVALGLGYSRMAPRWIDEISITNEGRFTGTRFRVGTLLG